MKNWIRKLKHLSRIEKIFCILLLLYGFLAVLRPGSLFVPVIQMVLMTLGVWIGFRISRATLRKAIWRLRNRLLVTYLFIAVVPVFLLVVLAGLGVYTLVRQLAVYLAVSNLERSTVILQDIAETLAASDPRARTEVMQRIIEIHQKRFPDLVLISRTTTAVQSWPPGKPVTPPPPGWNQVSGVTVRGGRYFLWSHATFGAHEATAMMPLSRRYLSAMVPGLGDVSLVDRLTVSTHEPPAAPLPSPVSRFDVDFPWVSRVVIWRWETPGRKDFALLFVHTRLSAVLRTIFNARVDELGDVLPIALMAVAILFLIVVLVGLAIGGSLTRTITMAVHDLYQGTQRVIQGDFGQRIQVHGRDQLATLSGSFNTMTENLERLLAVAKEKERLQAEIEIAREVQEQLYPKVMPELRTLRLTAVCEPARMVSGDYYDYLCLPDGRLALAIGDVAGKGISAALLMANIQAAMRMELRTFPSGSTGRASRVVSDLNQQLHATTAPEKYATFFFAFYDENSGELSYTNAGHLPPLLVRDGSATRLEVSGTVVGAFPFAKYDDDHLQMQSGDLLVCYTDGITEPENEYGEEFGEARLVDVITKNADQDDAKIVARVLEAVHHWSSAAEQPDDMTLLLARRV